MNSNKFKHFLLNVFGFLLVAMLSVESYSDKNSKNKRGEQRDGANKMMMNRGKNFASNESGLRGRKMGSSEGNQDRSKIGSLGNLSSMKGSNKFKNKNNDQFSRDQDRGNNMSSNGNQNMMNNDSQSNNQDNSGDFSGMPKDMIERKIKELTTQIEKLKQFLSKNKV